MKNAPKTIQLTVAALALVTFGLLAVQADRWMRIHSAQSWCEEYATLMLADGRAEFDGLKHWKDYKAAIGWSPRLFHGAYAFSAFVEAGVAVVDFQSPIGCYRYLSDGGWQKTGEEMPVMISATGRAR